MAEILSLWILKKVLWRRASTEIIRNGAGVVFAGSGACASGSVKICGDESFCNEELAL